MIDRKLSFTDVLERMAEIQRLYASPTEEEAITAAGLMQRLAVRYAIDKANGDWEQVEAPFVIDSHDVWPVALLNALAGLNDCALRRTPSGDESLHELTISGSLYAVRFTSTIDAYLYEAAYKLAEEGWEEVRKSPALRFTTNRRGWRNAFYNQFVNAVREHLAEVNRQEINLAREES